MANPLRFHNPGRHMGVRGKCEKCGGKMNGHMTKGDTLSYPEFAADDVEVVVPEPKTGRE